MIPGLSPEQEARVRAVGPVSPPMERAGAMLMGVYLPQSRNEAVLLVHLAADVYGGEDALLAALTAAYGAPA